MAPSEVPDYEPFDQPAGERMRQTGVVAVSPSLLLSFLPPSLLLSFLPPSLPPSSDPGCNNSGYYELLAVLTHQGRSSSSGHYLGWIRHREGEEGGNSEG